MAQLLTGALAQVDQARDQLRAGHPELAAGLGGRGGAGGSGEAPVMLGRVDIDLAHLLKKVSHHDIAAIWVAFFSRCQRFRRGQVCPGVCDDDTLAWDYDEVLGRLHAAGNVAAVLSGHDHKVRSLTSRPLGAQA